MNALLTCLEKARTKGVLLACVLVCSQLLWCAKPVLATTNPSQTNVPVNYRNTEDGPDKSCNYVVTPTATNGRWNTEYEPWNGKTTSEGNRIENTISPAGFTFTSGEDSVTATKCKYYYDARYGDWTFVSAATCAQNCYGYATGNDYWMEAPGFNVLMQDEYTINTAEFCVKGCILKDSGDHCYKLDDCCKLSSEPDTIKEISHKPGSGPVYKKTIACPPGGKNPNGTIYCKDEEEE